MTSSDPVKVVVDISDGWANVYAVGYRCWVDDPHAVTIVMGLPFTQWRIQRAVQKRKARPYGPLTIHDPPDDVA